MLPSSAVTPTAAPPAAAGQIPYPTQMGDGAQLLRVVYRTFYGRMFAKKNEFGQKKILSEYEACVKRMLHFFTSSFCCGRL
jgi:hypothetical protein